MRKSSENLTRIRNAICFAVLSAGSLVAQLNCANAQVNSEVNEDVARAARAHHDYMERMFAQQKASGRFTQVVPNDELGIHEGADIGGIKGNFDDWIGYLNGTLYRVLAGIEFSDEKTGVIIVNWGGENGTEFYHVPNSGPLELVAEQNGVLFMRGHNGKQYRFHVFSRKIE